MSYHGKERMHGNTYGKREISELEELNSNYIDFLSDCKTERECVKETVRQAREKGYKSLEEVIEKGQPLKPGRQSLCCLYE